MTKTYGMMSAALLAALCGTNLAKAAEARPAAPTAIENFEGEKNITGLSMSRRVNAEAKAPALLTFDALQLEPVAPPA